LVGICVVLLVILRLWDHREPSQQAPRDKSVTRPSLSRAKEPLQRASFRDGTGTESPVRFGIFGPSAGASGWYHPLATALRQINDYGYLFEIVAPPGTDSGALRSLLQGENIRVETCPFDAALRRLEVLLVLLDLETDGVTVPKLKSYVTSGGWLVVVNKPQLVRRIVGLPRGTMRKLNSTFNRVLGTRVSQARLLVSHPALPSSQSREWFPIPTLEGEVETSRPGSGLWLVAFKNPSCPGLRVLSVERGGVVDINWQAHEPGKLKEVESRDILHNTLAWLSEKRFWLPPERSPLEKVAGRVADEGGLPISEADVTARVFADWGVEMEELAARSDENGNFSLLAMSPSIYWFEASAKGFSQEDPFVMARCEGGTEDEPVTIVMRRAVGLSGTVYHDGREDTPASEFPVTLVPTDRDPDIERQRTVTDERGQFVFEKAPYGKTVLLVCQKGEWGGWKIVELPLDAEKKPERVKLAVERVPLVHGRVVDSQTQEPIAGASVKVTLRSRDPRQVHLSLFSDSLMRIEKSDVTEGFSFRLLPGLWELEGMAEGYIPSKASGFRRMWLDLKYELEVASGKTDPACPLTVELTKRESKKTHFYGTIYLPSGQPAPHAFVAYSGRVARSDSEGRYETGPLFTSGPTTIDGTPYYRFIFEIRCQNYIGYHRVLLEECPERCHQDFWLEEGKPVSGFVRDIKGNPVEGARVIVGVYHDPLGKRVAKAEAVFSGADGSFTFPGLVPRSGPQRMRSITLRAEKVVETRDGPEKYEGRARVWLPENDPIEDFDIVIAKVGPVITGTVSYHDGTPMRNHRVSMRLYGEGRKGGQLTDFARHLDDQGHFSLEGRGFYQEIYLTAREKGETNWQRPSTLFPESYELYLRTEYTVEGSTVRPESTLIVGGLKVGMTDLDIRFPPMGSIRVRLVDGETGLPIESFELNAQADPDYETWPQRTCWTREAESFQPITGGELRLVGLVPGPYGTYSMSIHTSEYSDPVFREVRVAGNETTDLGDIPLYRNWWVKGRIVAANTGQPIPATITGPRDLSTTTDDNGYFVLTMHRNTRSCKLRIAPLDKTWKGIEVSTRFGWQPTVDLGDVVLKSAGDE